MKILFLSDDFPPHSVGGAGIITKELAEGLRDAGHEISVITAVSDRALLTPTTSNGISIYPIYSNYPGYLSQYYGVRNPGALSQIRPLLRQLNPDIIHAHNIHHHISFHALTFARAFTHNVFFTAHDAMSFHAGKLTHIYRPRESTFRSPNEYKVSWIDELKCSKKRFNPLRNIAIRAQLKKVNNIFAISHELEKALRQNSIDNVTTIHYGIRDRYPMGPLAPRHPVLASLSERNVPIVLFGGRLSYWKGGDAIIDAMQEVIKVVPDAHLLVAGPIEEYARHMQQRIVGTPLQARTMFTGWISQDEMAEAYSIATICVIPSIYFDPFNLFNIESMSASRPVVGTTFGGTPEIQLHGKTGFIVNPHNTLQFSGRIIELLKNPILTASMGAQSRQRYVEHFQLDRYAAETITQYQQHLH